MTTDAASSGGPSRQPIAPAIRRRLQQCFEHGSRSAAKGDFAYASDMFSACVRDDPSNQIYIKQFLDNLAKKYNDNKKGAGFTSAPKAAALKGSIKKARYSQDWDSVRKSGIEMLKINPWDISTLVAMAEACDAQNFDEAGLVYLKQALDVNPKDADVNRICGRTLARLGQFDQAIACWHRVEQAKPGDDEAARAIGELAIEKTISRGGYESAESSTDVRAAKGLKDDPHAERAAKLSPTEQLEKQIAKTPDNVELYTELADLHTRDENHDKAMEVLKKALEASGGDVMVRERLEDSQLRRARQQVVVAEKKSAKDKTPEAEKLARKMKVQLNSMELDVYRSRAERYPNNVGLKYELGLRLKRAGEFGEAIKCFQAASGDVKRKGAVHMELGECFQQIKQYKLAMDNYEKSLEATTDREADQRKLGLYRAGKLALGLAEKYMAANQAEGQDYFGRAENHLNELAGIEFGYKDVAQLLDKIAKIRHKG
ncbi:MAG: tetratricopeptide repeat protein [Pirellulales bacterium]